MTNQVHALFFSQPVGISFGPRETLRGLFSTRELAEKELLDIVLAGNTVSGARIDLLDVKEPHDPKNPLNYPAVIAALIEGKKIQAIKALREKVDGLFLKEAKDLVEAVDLATIPQEVLAAGQKFLDDRNAEKLAQEEKAAAEHREALRQRESGVGERFEPVTDWMFSTWLIDEDDDVWGHIGDGKYVMLNCYGERDNWSSGSTEAQVDDLYTVKRTQEDTPDFDTRF